MDRGAWQAIVHRITKSRTQLSSYHVCVCVCACVCVSVCTLNIYTYILTNYVK